MVAQARIVVTSGERLPTMEAARNYLLLTEEVWPYAAAAALGFVSTWEAASQYGLDLPSFERVALAANERMGRAVRLAKSEPLPNGGAPTPLV